MTKYEELSLKLLIIIAGGVIGILALAENTGKMTNAFSNFLHQKLYIIESMVSQDE